MQVLYNNLRNGEVQVLIENLDDLWVLYNLIAPGDQIKGRTVRRVVIREGDTGERKPMTLGIIVENVEFHEFSNRLRVLGSIYEGPDDWVSVGQHHTFNLEPGHKIRIFKEQWLKSEINRLKKSLSKNDQQMVLAVAIESGMANLVLLSNYSLTPIIQIKENIPGKRYKKQQFKERVSHFFDNISNHISDNIERYSIGLIVICGPGFVKEQYAEALKEYLKKNQQSADIRTLNASSGEISAVYEILRNGSLGNLRKDFKLSQDELLMNDFITHLAKEDHLIAYGLEDVRMVAEMGAVDKLMVLDLLLRTQDKDKRKKIDHIMLNTEKNRGDIHVFNSTTPAGEQLAVYGQIAAILRFKVNN